MLSIASVSSRESGKKFGFQICSREGSFLDWDFQISSPRKEDFFC